AWAVLAAPAACAAFFIWELYSPPLAAVAVQASLLAALLVLAPRNSAMALAWRALYQAAAGRLERDIAAGEGVSSLAAEHAGFLSRGDARSVESGMALLRDGRVGPFRRARGDDARDSGATSR
ncbi:MAG: hypothetical protein H0U85_08525, partial [Gemmatimonadales bacterium]|nr:hypothetical protein [Gemmatimonadales bacterium]